MNHPSPAVPSPFALPGRWRPVAPLANRLLGLDRCQEIYSRLPEELCGAAFIGRLLRLLGLRAACDPKELALIPAKGGLLVVANHPFGGAEGLLLAHQLLQVRADVRILANRLLERVPQLRELLIPVDPFGGTAGGRRQPRPAAQGAALAAKGGRAGGLSRRGGLPPPGRPVGGERPGLVRGSRRPRPAQRRPRSCRSGSAAATG